MDTDKKKFVNEKDPKVNKLRASKNSLMKFDNRFKGLLKKFDKKKFVWKMLFCKFDFRTFSSLCQDLESIILCFPQVHHDKSKIRREFHKVVSDDFQNDKDRHDEMLENVRFVELVDIRIHLMKYECF